MQERVPIAPHPYQPHQSLILMSIFSHSSGCVVVPHCGFNSTSLRTSDVDYVYHMLCISSLGKCLSQTFAHFFITLFPFFN